MKTRLRVRVSTERQAERGSSLEAQAEKIRAMAKVQDVELSDTIVESGESAKSLNRTGMGQLLALIEAGKVKAVIVAKLDRLTRSVKDLCELLDRFERKGVALVSVAESLDTGSAAGRLVLNIMAAVSQWEREAIGERTRDALRHKRTQRERIGNLPFGVRLAPLTGGNVEDDPAEQATLAEIRGLRDQGASLRGIAAELNIRGRRTRRGTPWRFGFGCAHRKAGDPLRVLPTPPKNRPPQATRYQRLTGLFCAKSVPNVYLSRTFSPFIPPKNRPRKVPCGHG